MTRRILPCSAHFGGRLRSYQSCLDITLSEVEYTAIRKCPRHSHDRAFFSLLLQGGYEEQYGRHTVCHRPRTVSFRPAGTIHDDEITAAGTRFFIIEVADAWLSRLGKYSPRLDWEPHFCADDATWLATRLHDSVRDSPTASPLLVQGIVLDLLMSAARLDAVHDSQNPRWLGGVLEMVHAEFAQDLKLETISSHAGVHPAYLSRVFRRIFRESLGHYVNRLRVRYARAALAKNNGISLCEVALAAGFADQSHFTKIFKRVAGETPGAFRSTIIPEFYSSSRQEKTEIKTRKSYSLSARSSEPTNSSELKST
jgi:AraC family transcriptional regulator